MTKHESDDAGARPCSEQDAMAELGPVEEAALRRVAAPAPLVRIAAWLDVLGVAVATCAAAVLVGGMVDALRGFFGYEPWIALPVLSAAAAVIVGFELMPWPSEGSPTDDDEVPHGISLLAVVGGVVGLALLQRLTPGRLDPSDPLQLARLLVTMDVVALAAFTGVVFRGVGRRWYFGMALVAVPIVPVALSTAWAWFYAAGSSSIVDAVATTFDIRGVFAILVLSACPPFPRVLHGGGIRWHTAPKS